MFLNKFICCFLFSTPFASTINSYSYSLPKTKDSKIKKLIDPTLPINKVENKKFEISEKLIFNFEARKKETAKITTSQKTLQVPPPIL